MLEFKTPDLKDIKALQKFLVKEPELSCETNFTNLIIWHKHYNTVYYYDEKTLIFRMFENENFIFSIPYGDVVYGVSLIIEYCKEKNLKVKFWACEGERLNKFKSKFSDFDVSPERDSFEYIYSRDDLAFLKGKKYHSKRNHISNFSKNYNWEYEDLKKENIPEIMYFADKWYQEATDETLISERKALGLLLNNMDKLNVKGGMIRVDGRIVAFTLGTPINSMIFDIHYEKADKDFLTAYAVINREFALNELGNYKYINREDDLGIEGLRKAKLSYKPQMLLQKYVITFKGE